MLYLKKANFDDIEKEYYILWCERNYEKYLRTKTDL